MLRMQVVRGGRAGYYVGDLVPGRAEGTGVAGESPGAWTGGGAGVLGLRGRVEATPFTDLLSGRDPLGDRLLRQVPATRGVSGFDLVFCAPKSVSLLHLLGPRELAGAAGAAHDEAVAAAAAHLEREGLGVRRSGGGRVRYLPSTGMVAAGFVHRTSRSLDPHLHTHLVTANVVQGVDGLWSAVDSRRLFLHRRAAEGLYHAVLRDALARGLGAEWVAGPSGRLEVSGVDPVLCRLFSQRKAGIDQEIHCRVDAGRSSRRFAYQLDRPDKDHTVTVDGLRTMWRRRAADHGLDLGELVRVVGRRSVGRETGPERDRLGRGLDELAERRTAVARRDVVCALTAALPQGAPADIVERMAGALVDAAGPPEIGPGRRPGAAPSEERWTASLVAGSYRRAPELVERAWGIPDPVAGDRPAPGVDVGREPAGRGERSRDTAPGVVRRAGTGREGADERSGWDRAAGVVSR